MNKLLVILGSTATGKTDLAIKLAKKYKGELVACDSRQVYKGLDIGTGKFPGNKDSLKIKKGTGYWEINDVRVWMYDVVGLDKQYTVADYLKAVKKVIADIHLRGKLPIVVGGTGLYLKALLEGLPNLQIPVNATLRESLNNFTKQELQSELKKLSPQRWEALNESDRENPRRLLRSIELVSTSGNMIKSQISNLKSEKYNVLKIGLIAPRHILYNKVDMRVLDWIQDGIIEEVVNLTLQGINLSRVKELGLEYRLIAEYLESKTPDKEQLIIKIQNNIHGYVRRQLTWYQKEKNVHWIDVTSKEYPVNVEKLVNIWYH